MDKYVLIDNRMREIEKEKLSELGFKIIEIPTNKNTYSEISSHIDIFCVKINDEIILEKSLYGNILENCNNVLEGNSFVQNKYPLDIMYNICIIGNFAIHNFKYTDKIVLDLIDKYRLKKININQGYSKCSIAVIDENSAIVSDKKTAKILSDNGIDVLLINEENNIKLLDEKGNYSFMKGFIGGCIFRIENKIFVCGDLDKLDGRVKEFIEKRNLEIIDFKGLEIIDYGGIITGYEL